MNMNRFHRTRAAVSSTTMVALAAGGAMVFTVAWLISGGSTSDSTVTEVDLFTVDQGGFDISIPS